MMHMTKALFGAAAMVALMAGSAAAAEKAEVIHWWTSGGEAAAVQEFAKAFNAAGGEWVDAAVAGGGGDAARTAGINRIIGGNPPTAMQFNTGKQFDELVTQGLLSPLDDVADAEGWKQHINPLVLAAVTRDGKIYAAPVNIHSNIWLWYSPAALEKAGATAPKNWDEFFAAGDKLKAAGIVPVAQSGDAWTQVLTFNNVLIGAGGKDLYYKIYKDLDVDAVKSPEFKKVADIFAKLRDYTDAGMQGRQWNQATAMIVTGQAGFNFMGDWAKGEVIAAGKTPGTDVGCIPGLGNQEFWIGGDVFVFPVNKDPEATKAQKLLEKVLLSPDGQVAFNNKKGSIPVRDDVDLSKVDACAAQGIALAKAGNVVESTDILISPDVSGSFTDAIASFFSDKSKTSDDFVASIASIVEGAK